MIDTQKLRDFIDSLDANKTPLTVILALSESVDTIDAQTAEIARLRASLEEMTDTAEGGEPCPDCAAPVAQEPVAEIYRAHYGNRMGNIGVNAVRSLVAPDDMPPPGTKLYAHAAALVAQEPVAYLHTVTQNGADTDQALSFTPDAFPLQGVGGFRSIGIIPLYATPVAAQAHPVVKKSLITGLAQDREDAIPERDAVDLAREGMELHKPGQPEYIVCAELVRIAEGGR